jgi:hypothetical protein
VFKPAQDDLAPTHHGEARIPKEAVQMDEQISEPVDFRARLVEFVKSERRFQWMVVRHAVLQGLGMLASTYLVIYSGK